MGYLNSLLPWAVTRLLAQGRPRHGRRRGGHASRLHAAGEAGPAALRLQRAVARMGGECARVCAAIGGGVNPEGQAYQARPPLMGGVLRLATTGVPPPYDLTMRMDSQSEACLARYERQTHGGRCPRALS